MSKNEYDLEQRVNPYAAPCEATTLDGLYDSLAKTNRVKWFYRSLGLAILLSPLATEQIPMPDELVDFAYNHRTTIVTLQLIAVMGCLWQSERYCRKARPIQIAIENDQEILFKYKSLEEKND